MKQLLQPLLRLFARQRPDAREFDNSSLLDVREEWALPPLDAREVSAVLRDSDKAALDSVSGEPPRRNPYPEGSRQHRLWSDNFEAARSDLSSRR